MSEKTKNILKIFGIYYVIFLILSIVLCFSVPSSDTNPFVDILITLALCPISLLATIFIMAVIFSPAIFALYFLFKKFKERKTRIFLVAFLIPFLNMIYYLVEYFVNYGNEAFISMCIGFYSIIFFLPITLFVALITPKSLLPFKKEAIITLPLMFIIGWVLIFTSIRLAEFIGDEIESIGLKKYKPIIESIENYKAQNGIYPERVEDTVKCYKYFNYSTLNDNKDFILTVTDSRVGVPILFL